MKKSLFEELAEIEEEEKRKSLFEELARIEAEKREKIIKNAAGLALEAALPRIRLIP
jgi:hypothetical protein